MGLVINKAKKETVADYIFGAGIIGILISLGFYIYLPISKIMQSGKIGSVEQLFPLNRTLLAPFLGIAISVLLFSISAKLKKEGTWLANTYDKLRPGTLLLILLFNVWVALPLVGAFIGAFLLNKN